MKISFFHLMPYQDLPEDFAEQHHSAWVDLPNENFDPAKGNQYYAEYIDQLRYADEVGFDGICVNEHHNNAYGIMPSPNLIASVLANTTNNGALIVLGNSLALYNPPVRVAEEMAMLDVMSGGRLVAGFPVGTSMDTTFSYGQVPITLRERHTEAHDVIMQAWTQHQPTIFNGKYNKLRYISIWPRPMQQPHPPVWIPGSGSLETWDWVLDRDYVYCYLSYYGYLRGYNIVKGYWERAAERGVDDNPHRLGFLQLVCVSETDEQAEQDYEEHVQYFYEKMLRVYPPYAESPGYRSLGIHPQVVAPPDGGRGPTRRYGKQVEGLRRAGAHHRRQSGNGAPQAHRSCRTAPHWTPDGTAPDWIHAARVDQEEYRAVRHRGDASPQGSV